RTRDEGHEERRRYCLSAFQQRSAHLPHFWPRRHENAKKALRYNSRSQSKVVFLRASFVPSRLRGCISWGCEFVVAFRGLSLDIHELVAHSPRGQDQLGILSVALDLVTQTTDDGVDGPSGDVGVSTPDLREQRFAAEHDARMRGEHVKQIEFLLCQVHRFPAHRR